MIINDNYQYYAVWLYRPDSDNCLSHIGELRDFELADAGVDHNKAVFYIEKVIWSSKNNSRHPNYKHRVIVYDDRWIPAEAAIALARSKDALPWPFIATFLTADMFDEFIEVYIENLL